MAPEEFRRPCHLDGWIGAWLLEFSRLCAAGHRSAVHHSLAFRLSALPQCEICAAPCAAAVWPPERLAHVGLGEQDAKDKGIEIDTFRQELSEVDRAILEGEDEGFVKVHVRKGTDEILGATIVAANAGDIIGEICLAITQRIGLKKIASTIHPYPTQGEAIRKIGDLFNRTRLTPFKRSILTKWLSWTR